MWSRPGAGKTPTWIPIAKEDLLRGARQQKEWGRCFTYEVFKGRNHVREIEVVCGTNTLPVYHGFLCSVEAGKGISPLFDTIEEAVAFAEGK